VLPLRVQPRKKEAAGMFGNTTLLIAVIVIAVALVSVMVFKPSVTITRGGKILAFVSIFVFPALAGSMGFNEHIQRSKSTHFCTSCHVMQDYGKSLFIDDPAYMPAAHYQNNRVPRDQACYTCHTDYTMFGGAKAKMRGLKHVYVQYLGKIPDKVELYTPYNNRECLRCHSGARNFEEGATHTMEEGRLELIKSNQLSCSNTECHGGGHSVKDLGSKTFWTAGASRTDSTGSESDQPAKEEK
jgi:cytochrome c-type protein NapC